MGGERGGDCDVVGCIVCREMKVEKKNHKQYDQQGIMLQPFVENTIISFLVI